MIALDFPLHFLRPWWWLALALLPVAMWMLARSGGGRAALSRLADAALLPHLIRDAGTRIRAALGLFAVTWLVAVAALSGPAWQKVATPLYVNGSARVVVLSLADDMLAQDVKPDRMTRARFAVRDLLDGAGDARTALVAYAGEAFTVAPLTNDKHTVLNFLQALRPDVMPVPGNDAAAGIRQGVELLQQAHVDGGEIVLVTDRAGAAAVDAARAAQATGIRVDVLGIGTAEGAPVPQAGGGFANGSNGLAMARRDDGSLRAIANAGGGDYVALHGDGDGAARLGVATTTAGHADRGEQARLWRDGGVWLLPILLVLAALAFRRGWLLVIALAVLPMATPTAQASTWSSLWANRDQRALQALQRGDAGQARELATTEGIRGAADYRAGDYAGAAKAFAHGADARAHYNRGNALAKQGEYQKAIGAYDQALRQEPDFADARANRDAVEAWLKKHPPQSQPGGQGQAQQNNRQDQSGSSKSQQGRQQDQAGSDQSQSQPGQGTSQQGGQQDQSGGDQSQGGDSKPQPGQDAQPNASANPQGSGGTSVGEAARQQDQAEQAKQDLDRALQGARGDASGPGGDKQHAFALGQSESKDDSQFNAEQRAMLRAVPDDPGALLRRKFRLEWEQRNGQRQEDGS